MVSYPFLPLDAHGKDDFMLQIKEQFSVMSRTINNSHLAPVVRVCVQPFKQNVFLFSIVLLFRIEVCVIRRISRTGDIKFTVCWIFG